jgi:hypothetical protein
MNKISIKGVLIGGIVDVATSIVLGIPIAIYAFAKIDFAHTPKDQMAAAMTAAMNGHPSIFVIQMVVGLACSALGGYVAARLAKHDELLNGTLSSFLCTAIGIYSIAAGKDSHSLAVQILTFVGSPVFALIGGYLALLHRGKTGLTPPA